MADEVRGSLALPASTRTEQNIPFHSTAIDIFSTGFEFLKPLEQMRI